MQTVARVPRNSTEQISFRGNGTQPRVFRSPAGSLKVCRSARERERVVWRPWNRVATWPARATACSIASASVLPFPCHLYRASKPGFRFKVALKLVATRDERKIRCKRKEEEGPRRNAWMVEIVPPSSSRGPGNFLVRRNNKKRRERQRARVNRCGLRSCGSVMDRISFREYRSVL